MWESIGEHEVLEASFDRQFDKQRTFGEAAADNMAAIGGSWGFVVGFAAFIVAWTTANLALPLKWDGYPFILLNLFLSMLVSPAVHHHHSSLSCASLCRVKVCSSESHTWIRVCPQLTLLSRAGFCVPQAAFQAPVIMMSQNRQVRHIAHSTAVAGI